MTDWLLGRVVGTAAIGAVARVEGHLVRCTLPEPVRRTSPRTPARSRRWHTAAALSGSLIVAGDPEVLVVMSAGYGVARLAWLLRDLPVQVLARVRADRVFYIPAAGQVGRATPA